MVSLSRSLTFFGDLTQSRSHEVTALRNTSCSAIVERPRCRMR